MKTYSVKEVSDLLGTSTSNVRQWISSGKLNAIKGASNKEGYAINEEDLRKFLGQKSSKKYRIAAQAAGITGIVAATTAGIAAGATGATLSGALAASVGPIAALPIALLALIGMANKSPEERNQEGGMEVDAAELREEIRELKSGQEKRLEDIQAEIEKLRREVESLNDKIEKRTKDAEEIKELISQADNAIAKLS